MKHVNIPVFIPHLGCPNQCVFCDQRTISGVSFFSEEIVKSHIESILSTVNKDEAECEIAFFGGSFTGIDRDLMVRLLDVAERYVCTGDVSGIRMSTRPDYINEDIISILKKYTVSEFELGIQNISDRVLNKCRRGHTSKDTVRACELLKSAGFRFVGQMMIGLPGADVNCEIECARLICELGASGARIYPTIVFRGTELEKMTVQGEYAPLTAEEAAERSAEVLDVLTEHGVPCIRMGLCESENLRSSDKYFAGPNHPAMGELIAGELYRKRIAAAIVEENISEGDEITVEVPTGAVSKAAGHAGRNRLFFSRLYSRKIKFVENNSLMEYNVKIRHN